MSDRSLAGKCLCGAVAYQLLDPPRVHYCHCTMCQRATGSAAAVLAWVHSERLLWTRGKPPTEYRSSPIARRSFCASCGTPMTLAYDGGDEIAFHLGTLDQKAEFSPRYHYGAEGQLPWFDAGAALPREETLEKW